MRRFDELVEAGFEAIELWAAFGPNATDSVTFEYTNPNAVEAVAGALSSSGIRVHSMHGPMFLGPPNGHSPFGYAGLEGLLEAERAGLDAVMSLGGRFLVTQDAAERLPEDVPHLASEDALRQLAEYAVAHGCAFCVENGAESAEAIDRLVALVHRIGHPGLGICLDVGHAQVWCFNDVPRLIRAAGQWLRTVHLHDNIGVADAHQAAGDGILPWHAILEALREVGYRGPLLSEAWSGGGRGSVVEVLTRARALLGSLADRSWDPVARAGGADVFPADEADRRRARSLLSASIGDADDAVIAVDRFGDPVAWAEAAGDDEAVLVMSARVGAGEAGEVARATLSALRGPSVRGVRAEGHAAAALVATGFASDDAGIMRPGNDTGSAR